MNISNFILGNSQDQSTQSNLLDKEPSQPIDTTPAIAGEILGLKNKTGLDSQYISENLDSVKKESNSTPYLPPKTQSFIDKDPAHYPLVKNDIPKITSLEEQGAFDNYANMLKRTPVGEFISGMYDGWTTDKLNAEKLDIYSKIMESGKKNLDDQKKIDELNRKIKEINTESPSETGKLVGSTARQYGKSILLGAGTTFALQSGGLTYAAYPLLVGGSTLLTNFIDSYYQSKASAYEDYTNTRDKNNIPMNHETAKSAAEVAGFFNGMIETASDAILTRIWKPLAGLIGVDAKPFVKKVFSNPSYKKALITTWNDALKSSGVEGLEEFFQTLVQAAGKEYAQENSGQNFEPVNLESTFKDALMSFKDAAIGTFILGGGLGSAHSIYSTRADIIRGQKIADHINNIAKTINESEMAKASPEKTKEYINQASDSSLYVDAQDFQSYMQSIDADPSQAAKELGIKEEEYKNAVENGTDLKISLGDFITKVSSTEFVQGLFDISRFTEEGLSNKERTQVIEALSQLETELKTNDQQETEQSPIEKLTNQFNEALTSLGLGSQESNANATLSANALSYFARNTNTSLESLVKKYKYRIEKNNKTAVVGNNESNLTTFNQDKTFYQTEEKNNNKKTALDYSVNKHFVKDEYGDINIPGDQEKNYISFYLTDSEGNEDLHYFKKEDVFKNKEVGKAYADYLYNNNSWRKFKSKLFNYIYKQDFFSIPKNNFLALIKKSGIKQGELDYFQLDGLINAIEGDKVTKSQVLHEINMHYPYVESDVFKSVEYGRIDDYASSRDIFIDDISNEIIRSSKKGIVWKKNGGISLVVNPGDYKDLITGFTIEISKTGRGKFKLNHSSSEQKFKIDLGNKTLTDFEDSKILDMLNGQIGYDDDDIIDFGFLEFEIDQTMYKNYTSRFFKQDYTEEVITSDPIGRIQSSTHFESYSEGQTLHIRHSNVIFEDHDSINNSLIEKNNPKALNDFYYQRAFILEEIQSDLFNTIKDYSEEKIKELVEYEYKYFKEDIPFAISFLNHFKKIDNWVELAIKKALLSAANNKEITVFAMMDENEQNIRWDKREESERKKFNLIYGLIAKKILQKFSKKYNKELSHTKIERESHGLTSGMYYFEFTDEMRKNLLEEETYLFQEDNSTKRGMINIGDREFDIKLLQESDRSTFMHEMSHSFLEMFKNYEGFSENSQQINDDINTIKEVLGVSSLNDLKRDHHEKFAEMFESYLQKGEAPTEKLKGVFNQFRRWLIDIYNRLTKQNIELDPRLKPVFDRLIQGEEELKKQEKVQPTPLFNVESLKQIGMTQKQIDNYMGLVTQFRADKLERINKDLSNRIKVFYTDEYEKESKEIIDNIKIELDDNPTARLLSALENNETPSGKSLGENQLKINLNDIAKNYPQFYKDIPDKFMDNNGISVKSIMSMFGYETHEELFKDLKENSLSKIINEQSAPLINDLIKELEDKYGEMYNSAKIEDTTIDSIYNETKADITREEIKFILESNPELYKTLSKKFSSAKSTERVMRATAKQAISLVSYKELNPSKFQRAERKNHQLSIKEFFDGNIENALAYKQKALLNHYMVSESAKVRAELDKGIDRLKRFKLGTKQKQLGISDSFSYHINNLITRFGLVNIPSQYLKLEADKLEFPSLAEFINHLQSSGKSNLEAISINPNHLNEAYKSDYKSMPVAELRDLIDTIKQLETIAIQENKFFSEKEKLEFKQVIGELNTAIDEYSPRKRNESLSKSSETLGSSTLSMLRAFDASLIKIERMFIWLDGGRDGAFHKYIWNPLIDAENKEITYKEKLLTPVYKLISDHLKKNKEVLLSKIKSGDISFTRSEVIMMGLNLGNESNKDKLIRGEAIRGRGITEQVIMDAVSQLTNEEIDLIQEIWNTYETVWPDVENLQKELTGLIPERVELTPIKIGNRTLRGGYFPVLYDSRYSKQAEMQLGSIEGELLEKGYQKATTYKGHTKSRVQQFAAPMNLDFAMFPNHLNSVLKDLSHRKWLINMNKIISNQEFINKINSQMGTEYRDLFKEWIKRVINEKNVSEIQMKPWNDMLGTLASNVMTASLGFKASVFFSQFAGIFPALNELDKNGIPYFTNSLGEYFRNSKKMQIFIREKSTQMANRFDEKNDFYRNEILRIRTQELKLEPNAESIISNLKEAKEAFAKIQELSLVMAGYAESIVSTIAWHAAYTQHMKESDNQNLEEREKEAILKGDSIVRLSQGGRTMKEKAAVATSNGIMKYVTMFYTPFSALYSQMRDAGFNFGKDKDKPKLITQLFLTVVFPAIISELLSGRGPEEPEDPEEWLKFISKQTATYPFLSIPILRDGVSAITSEFGYQFSPIAQALSTPLNFANAAKKYSNDEIDGVQFAGKSLNTLGTLMGIPSKQIQITAGYWGDIINGNESPDDFLEFLNRSIYRK